MISGNKLQIAMTFRNIFFLLVENYLEYCFAMILECNYDCVCFIKSAKFTDNNTFYAFALRAKGKDWAIRSAWRSDVWSELMETSLVTKYLQYSQRS